MKPLIQVTLAIPARVLSEQMVEATAMGKTWEEWALDRLRSSIRCPNCVRDNRDHDWARCPSCGTT